MNSSIRMIVGSDINLIAAIHAASWRSAYQGILSNDFLDGDLITDRTALWTKRLSPQPPDHFGHVVSLDNRPVGFCYAFGDYDKQWGSQIDNLHVVPECKNKGLGRALLGALAREAIERYTGTGLFLWVYEQNQAARAFYERLGATPVERTEIDAPGGGLVAEWRYAWRNAHQLLNALEQR